MTLFLLTGEYLESEPSSSHGNTAEEVTFYAQRRGEREGKRREERREKREEMAS